ncbi:MAG: hypothetical protein E7476_09120 [Ruminococcaceae bacterium]|nr:hypothetical protein [Oscillospiraceae bacterium]
MYSIKQMLQYSVSAMLVLLTALITVPFAIYYEHNMLQVLSEDRQDSLSLISQKADAIFSSAGAISDLLYRDELIAGTIMSDSTDMLNLPSIKAQIDQTYTKYYEAFKQIDVLFYIVCIANNGFQYSSRSDYKDTDFQRIRSFSWFTKHIASKTNRYIINTVNERDGNFSIAVIRNLFTQDGAYSGSIFVCVPESILSSTYNNLIDKQNKIYILDTLSVAISSNDKSKLGTVPFVVPDYRFVRGNENYSIHQSQNQEFFSAKFTSETTGWTIYEQIPLVLIRRPIRQLLGQVIAIAVSGCMLSILLSTLLAKKISQPLQGFCSEMEFSIANYFEPIAVNYSLSEVQTMRSQFNRLLDKIVSLMEGIRQKEAEVNTVKFNFLKAQINPHFLYNTLFSIKCTVLMNQPQKASEMIEILISLLRNSINSNDSENSLLDESIYLTKYVELQNLRYDHNIALSINLPERFYTARILRFLLQPIVENAVLHGLTPDGGKIIINVMDDEPDLLIEICNNGKSFTESELQAVLLSKESEQPKRKNSSTHIGLNNIQQRIQLHYGKNYGLFIRDNPDYNTAVCMRLPKIK